MIFFLGTHEPSWLNWLDVPLFVSRRRLDRLHTVLPRALGPWALDSGGFTELQLNGGWSLSATEYARTVRHYRDEIGNLAWVAPQDWMCEPHILKKTGLDVRAHQQRTAENFIELRALLGPIVVPVLQGWTLGDYLEHAEAYARLGVDLAAEGLVGVGSVCRRQHTDEAVAIFGALAQLGLRTHGFGLKLQGLEAGASLLASADSMSWSLNARKHAPLKGCAHASCANCERWALRWRGKVLRTIRDHEERL